MWLEKTALVLAAIGAINWGLQELGFGLVDLVFGTWPVVASIVYWVIAVCGVFALYKVFK